ncbi:hypothetical protein RJ639_002331 [Escallonia herrerae]|uniref:Chromatin modification-related protein MEAF6 n=1 Tax=Escallonia herrerae TaxID=1293975 RepID=A0AA88XFE9_9ASTE|nr:hypothetical protein RJ639_002331 [Escallonia herrerae]
METQGQRASSNPKVVLASLLSKRGKLQEELRTIEKQVYELETSYLQESSNFGNVWKGFEGFLSSSKNTTNLKRSRKFQLEDRLFSLSSVTSPAAEELGVGRDDGRPDLGQARFKGGGLAISGQGKPKRGRIGPRDGKKIMLSNDLDLDDEDDPDLSLR